MPPAPPLPESDNYLPGFLIFGLPMMLILAGVAIAAVRKRSRAVAIICGAVFLLTAGSLVQDAGRRPKPADALVVLGIALASGLGGLALIIAGARWRAPAIGGPEIRGRDL